MKRFLATCTLNLLTVINIYIICLLIHTALKIQLYLARLCELAGYAIQRRILKIVKKKWNRGSGKGVPRGPDYFWNDRFSNLSLKSNDKNHNMKGVSFAVENHFLLKSLSGIIDKNLSILYMDKKVKGINPMTHGFIS